MASVRTNLPLSSSVWISTSWSKKTTVTTIQCSSFPPILAKNAKMVSWRSPAVSNSIQALVLEASLGTMKLSSPRHTAETPSTIDRRRRKLSLVPCCPPLQGVILPRFFQLLTASRMMLWKMPLNGIPPSKRSTGTPSIMISWPSIVFLSSSAPVMSIVSQPPLALSMPFLTGRNCKMRTASVGKKSITSLASMSALRAIYGWRISSVNQWRRPSRMKSCRISMNFLRSVGVPSLSFVAW